MANIRKNTKKTIKSYLREWYVEFADPAVGNLYVIANSIESACRVAKKYKPLSSIDSITRVRKKNIIIFKEN